VRQTEDADHPHAVEPVYATRLVPAKRLDDLTDLVAVGGDALADSEALYDGRAIAFGRNSCCEVLAEHLPRALRTYGQGPFGRRLSRKLRDSRRDHLPYAIALSMTAVGIDSSVLIGLLDPDALIALSCHHREIRYRWFRSRLRFRHLYPRSRPPVLAGGTWQPLPVPHGHQRGIIPSKRRASRKARASREAPIKGERYVE